MQQTLSYHRNAERPAAAIWWRDGAGNLIDFSSGYTFTLKIGRPGTAAVLTKTAGITGAAGAGIEPTGTPNVVITWTAGELDLAPDDYVWQLTATSGGLDRDPIGGVFTIFDTIT